jgi:membrane associated rhomboid family serine protease
MERLKQSFIWAAVFVIAIWAVFIVDFLPFWHLSRYGIKPRNMTGLIGIVTCPFLHGGFFHIIANSIPLFVFVLLTNFFYRNLSLPVILFIIIIGGGLVWLFGRFANHIGASGLIYGLFGFLLLAGFFKKRIKLILLSIIIGIIYSGLIFSLFFQLFPVGISRYISWESHLFGFISGGLIAYLLRHKRITGEKNA